MQQYIYRIQLLRPQILTDGPTERESEILEDHAAYLSELTEQSKVLLAGRTQTVDPDAFGIVILSVSSEDEAINIMNNDPAVKYKVMKNEIFPFKIAFLSENTVQSAASQAQQNPEEAN